MASIHQVHTAITIDLIPQSEFQRVYQAEFDPMDKLALLADMARANTLAMVKRAGSGHLGSSFSAMDIVTLLYYDIMNTTRVGFDSPDRDIYFSSKGHDVPGLYATLHGLGVLSAQQVSMLRRFNGLDGHPDKSVAGIEANSGSLGMGISKGKGMAMAKRMQGYGGRVFVLTGDGEWQEGQNYEALHSAAYHQVDNLIVIMDHNKLQSDKPVDEIMALGDLVPKFEAFGWHVARCDGHDLATMKHILLGFNEIPKQPKLLIADTIKGRGVSFMEHPHALQENDGLYPWHAGAPDDLAFDAGYQELIARVEDTFVANGLGTIAREDITNRDKKPSGVSKEFVATAYGEALLELGKTRDDIVVLDADLAADCRIRDFENTLPHRFLEHGIAEQDMVSTAAGIASLGMIPVVNSFASFLAARANEQIYNAATEHNKIVYAATYAGLIPAGPGKSHQSIRDVALMNTLPNITILQPCNAQEARWVTQYALDRETESCMIRLAIGPSPRLIQLPDGYELQLGRGAVLAEGNDALIFGYGPVMLHEALRTHEILQEQGVGLRVVNMPWLNRVDTDWLAEVVADYPQLYVIEDHAPQGALGDTLLNALNEGGLLAQHHLTKFAVEGFPACGTPTEALQYHQLDGASLAKRIRARMES